MGWLTRKSAVATKHQPGPSKFHPTAFAIRNDIPWNAGISSATFGPTAEPADLLIHGFGQGHCLGQGGQNVPSCQFFAGIKGIVESADDGLFDLRTTEIGTTLDQGRQIKIGRVAVPLSEMNTKDILPLFLGRQIDKEDFIQPALAKQFGRQLRNVVGRRDDKNRGRLLGKPGKKCSENPSGGSRSEEHTSELQSRFGISYAVFCLKK